MTTSCEVKFVHPNRDSKHISGFTILILMQAMKTAKVNKIWITSTYRNEEDQARVMLENLVPGRTMYRGDGQKVEAIGAKYASERKVIRDGLARGFDPTKPLPRITQSREEVEAAMALKIHELERHNGIGCVSHHQMNPRVVNVLDIDPKFVDPSNHLIKFTKVLTASASVSRIGLPGGIMRFSEKHFRESVGCLHLEILQPLLENSSKNFSNIA